MFLTREHNGIATLILAIALGHALHSASAAQSAEEHQQHHPQPSATATPAATRGTSSSGMSTNGSGSMEQMMSPPENMQQQLFPTLIQLPADLDAKQRGDVQRLAEQRVSEGKALIASAALKLAKADQDGDAVLTSSAADEIRRGQALVASGVAAQKALASGQRASEVGLRWFKQETDLAPSLAAVQPHGFFGLNWFHYITMAFMAAFVAAMIWMYFHKMRRANALLERLTGIGPEGLSGAPGRFGPSTASEPLPVNAAIAPTKSNSWSGVLKVSEIFDETPNVKTLRLTDPSGGKLPFNYLPGQFVTVGIENEGRDVKRSYTIASSPTKRDYCEITVKREDGGIVSCHLHDKIVEGDLLKITGPSGRFTFSGEDAGGIVLIAGGVGVTPLMSVLRYLTDRAWPGEIFFFFACKNRSDIIFCDELEFLARRHRNLHLCLVVEEGQEEGNVRDRAGRITREMLAEQVPDIGSKRIHICGPPPMMEAVKQMLIDLDVPDGHVYTEIFIGRPAPAASGNAVGSATRVVSFARSKKKALITADRTILDASEEVGADIDYSCRAGYCGTCKTRLLTGDVAMGIDGGLMEAEKRENLILACQARPLDDVSIDA